MITNPQSGTRIDEVSDQIYRISTPIPPEAMEGGFSFNQYLVVDEEPLLFHTGPRAMFPLVREAIASVLPVERLRHIGFSHVESDECGSLNQFLEIAPQAEPLCSRVAALVSVNDLANRPARALGDVESISTGRHRFTWIDAPHLPHNWENGFLYEASTGTLFCGDLFTQGGHQTEALTSGDILSASEAFRKAGIETGLPDAYSFAPGSRALLRKLADMRPATLACMHGSAWSDGSVDGGGALLRGLADALGV